MGFRANASPSNIVSGSFGVEVITLDGSGLGQGSDQPCREVTVWPEASKSIKIGESTSAANGGPVLIADYLIIPIENTNKLHFKGTSGDKVYLLWRS